jgi:hypothetical protein
MAWLRHHFYCEGCNGSWLLEDDVAITADCPFCSARDTFPYRSDERPAATALKLVVLESPTAKNGHSTRGSRQKVAPTKLRAKAASR